MWVRGLATGLTRLMVFTVSLALVLLLAALVAIAVAGTFVTFRFASAVANIAVVSASPSAVSPSIAM
ncbi:MAG: hypothetical protein B7Y21_11475 [Hydrogenophilales bacterium 16-61-112]|nr:MAG: hypothetical protein B7Y21_11475 [Hydrogenophilales bacterium 16-61-112]